jgi:acetoin utilization deacetylase AcuC-like enzyme
LAKVGLLYDPLYLWHDTGAHPENALRLTAIMHGLTEAGLTSQLVPLSARDASVEEIERVHDGHYVAYIHEMAENGGAWADPDTYIAPRSYDAAVRAAGGAIAATDQVLDGEVESAFCLVRPPGHHAMPDHAMGFCLFNNIAIVARHVLAERGLERIAIVDFDIHHGNGTQAAFYDDPKVLYFSTHQYPYYPGTGHLEEMGAGAGRGYNVNVPLPAGCGDAEYRRVFAEALEPLLNRYRPQLILVSAGYDGHFDDPLASMTISVAGYGEMMSFLKRKAAEMCGGKVVCLLEGGYHLLAEAWSVRTCLEVLLGETPAPDPFGKAPEGKECEIDRVLSAVKSLHGLTVSPQTRA